MAADAWSMYDRFPELLANGTIDIDTDALRCVLVDVTSNACTMATSSYGDLTGELATGSGYTALGVLASAVTWVNTTGSVILDSDDYEWLAAGGNIIARRGVIYDSVASGSPLIAQSLLDNTPTNACATDGNRLKIVLSASGIFKLHTA